ncbi:MAG: L,D-transpeptidase, partial [Candidatus Parcubacteria bacterium]|nr:L,D-transpeptidase [Candidatus Parcubacteria bacterium]
TTALIIACLMIMSWPSQIKAFTPLNPESPNLQAENENDTSSKLNKNLVSQRANLTGFSQISELPDSIPQMIVNDSLFIYINVTDTPKTLSLVSIQRDSFGQICSLQTQTRLCSPGQPGENSILTPTGNFKIMIKKLHGHSHTFHVPTPYWMAFSPDSHALGIHALPVSYEGGYLQSLGRCASHGCVRLSPEAAEYLFNRVVLETKVFIR